MTPDQTREIALRHARDVMGIHDPRLAEGIVEFANRFLAEIQKASEPVAWMMQYKGKCMGFTPYPEEHSVPVYTVPPAPAIPDDMVLVPREPTKAMKQVGAEWINSGDCYDAVSIYTDMIAAAEEKK